MSLSYPDLNLTNFPEAMDDFVEMLDIVASDATSLSAYQNAIKAGNISQANEALLTMQDATKKILTADKINKIYDSIEALERFLVTDIEPYVEQLQASWQNEINKFVYRGEYNSETIYSKNNIVSYSVGVYKYLYLCIANTQAGIDPTNIYFWKELTMVGTRGESGENFSFLYNWNKTTEYQPEDVVVHNGIIWGCLVSNTNSEPIPTNQNWEELASLNATIYPIQEQEPLGQQTNDLWFKQIGSGF